MSKVIIIKNGAALNSPVGFDPVPGKDEAPRVQLEASGTERPCKETFDAPIVQETQRQRKAFFTLQAQFARLGFELKSKQHPAGVTLFEVSRHGQTRVFSHFGDVGAYLTQLQQGGHHA